MLNIMCEECGRNKETASKEKQNILVGTCLDCYRILHSLAGSRYEINGSGGGKCSLVCAIENLIDELNEARKMSAAWKKSAKRQREEIENLHYELKEAMDY